MQRVEKTVFISYRRTNYSWALNIYQNLARYRYDVFLDLESGGPGDFEQDILENVRTRAHFIVVLTPSSLERCNERGDWFRREIETALEAKRNIVPVFFDGFDFNTPQIADQLTGKLAPLRKYNGLSIPPTEFLDKMVRLRERWLSVRLAEVSHPPSPPALQTAAKQKAIADALPAVQLDELVAQQWVERGFVATDVNEKVRFYSEAIRLVPGDAVAFHNRGVAYYKKGHFEAALKDYNKSIRLRPGYAEAFNSRAGARLALGDSDGALRDYDTAIRLCPYDADYFYNRGIVRGEVKAALKDYNAAIRLRPDYADAYCNRGNVRQALKDLEGAVRDYDTAIMLDPEDPVVFYNRGNAHTALGQMEEALKDYDAAIRLRPDYTDAFCNRGNAKKEHGEIESALRDYDAAIRLSPLDAALFHDRAIARRMHGDVEGAIADERKAFDFRGMKI